jgi:hypothetical protein
MTDVREATIAPEDPAVIEIYEDYFGFGLQEEFVLPDGKQKVFFKVMNEGERTKFQKRTSKDIKFNRATNDAAIKADPAEERRELIMTSVTGWSLKMRTPQGWVDAPFSTGSSNSDLAKWLDKANPKIVDDLELAIRKANPWMQADMTLEEIQKERDRLDDLERQIQERERGEASSSSK